MARDIATRPDARTDQVSLRQRAGEGEPIMFKDLRKKLTEKATAAKQVADDKSQELAESFVEDNLPAIRRACDQAVAKLGVDGLSASEGTRVLSARVVADDRMFEPILRAAYGALPHKPMPCWLFVRISTPTIGRTSLFCAALQRSTTPDIELTSARAIAPYPYSAARSTHRDTDTAPRKRL